MRIPNFVKMSGQKSSTR